jgi:hypothetical protein
VVGDGAFKESTLQVLKAYTLLPESVPLVQVLVCDTQVLPTGTDKLWNAATEEPLGIERPSRVHDEPTPAVQLEY